MFFSVGNFVTCDKDHWNLRDLLRSNNISWPGIIRLVRLVDILKVEVVEVHRQGESDSDFCKCLSQANALATQEWREGQWVSV